MGSKRRRSALRRPTEHWPNRDKRPKVSGHDIRKWVVDQWVKDSTIGINGRDGMVGRLLEVFGKTLRTEDLVRLRDDAHKQRDDKTKETTDMAARRHRQQHRQAFNPVLKPATVISLKGSSSSQPSADTMPKKKKPTGPGHGTSREDQALRREYAVECLSADPAARNVDINAKIVKKYGLKVSQNTLAQARRELGIVKVAGTVKKTPKKLNGAAPKGFPPTPMPKAKAKAAKAKRAPKASNEGPIEVIRTAIEMLVEDVPGLRNLELSIENGKPRVTYEVQTVQTGELDL